MQANHVKKLVIILSIVSCIGFLFQIFTSEIAVFKQSFIHSSLELQPLPEYDISPPPVNEGERCQPDDVIEHLSRQRRTRLKEQCQKYLANGKYEKTVEWPSFRHEPMHSSLVGPTPPKKIWWTDLLVSEKFQAIYCAFPKSSNTLVKYYLFNVAKNNSMDLSTRQMGIHWTVNEEKNPYLCRLDLFPRTLLSRRRLVRYYKFFFAREPLERVISAWHDKLFDRDPHYVETGMEMIRAVRSNASLLNNTELLTEPPLSLQEFFNYLIAQNDSYLFDHHWRPQALIARACELSYDFIGTMENLPCELEYVTRKISGKTQVPKIPAKESLTNRDEMLEAVEPGIVKAVIEKYYQIDYDLLGFQLPF